MQDFDFKRVFESLLYNEKYPLMFNSGFFLFFFCLFLMTYFLFSKTNKARIYFLTFFSLYFFYKACNWYVGFIILAAIIDFKLSNYIYVLPVGFKRKLMLWTSIFLNLLLLFTFKYTDFFIGIMNDVSHSNINLLKLALPVGISFYTFENLSYTLDVYDEKVKPLNKFIDYLFFLSFFPKLMMGPIVRAKDFLPQIQKKPFVTKQQVGEGLYLITAGVIKKVIISDYINANFVRVIFDNPGMHTGIECLMAVYGYAMVIYCDFSGYSDMAIGMAKWVGFEINVNFLSPYQSASITEFWKRWHISLSSWLKDYLYIRWLGGNRKGKIRTKINLIITMLLGGFWHGASWNFIFWGALHGTALVVDKIWNNITGKFIPKNWIVRIVGVLITFHFVCFCWIFFRSTTFANSWLLIDKIVNQFKPYSYQEFFNNYYSVFVILGIGFFLHFIPSRIEEWYKRFLIQTPLVVKILYLFICIFIAIQFKQADAIKPIYLQF
jgi:alginate O-acetyltransferase complex protein AlgI